MKIRLLDIGHARSGDKGDTANIGVIAREPRYYPLLERYLTAARVRSWFEGICHGPVERYELPNLEALNFVLHSALGGGGTRSLRNDSQGKTLASVLLRMELEIPDHELPGQMAAPHTIHNPEGNPMPDQGTKFLRHTVATVAYRGAKALRGAPDTFADTRIGPTTRTPLEILTHIGDLFDWALSVAKGEETWHNSAPLPWQQEVDRFFASLRAFDDFLASGTPLSSNFEKLFQGPVADALTHIGQIALLRRMSDAPVKGENYSRAEIVAGRIGPEQSSPRREFD